MAPQPLSLAQTHERYFHATLRWSPSRHCAAPTCGGHRADDALADQDNLAPPSSASSEAGDSFTSALSDGELDPVAVAARPQSPSLKSAYQALQAGVHFVGFGVRWVTTGVLTGVDKTIIGIIIGCSALLEGLASLLLRALRTLASLVRHTQAPADAPWTDTPSQAAAEPDAHGLVPSDLRGEPGRAGAAASRD